MDTRGFVLALGMAFCGLMAFTAPSAHSATITVTANAPDVLNGANASCSLREAITNINNAASTYADCANTGAAYGTSDTINIPAGTYTSAIASTIEDLNANGDFDILRSVTIVGVGAGSTTVNGGGLDRVFHIIGFYTLSISGVTITGGNVAAPWDGGGIYNAGGTLIVTNSSITNNTAGDWGGGIFNSGTLTVTNCTITGNTALNLGGSIFNWSGALTVTNSTISGNTATNNGGGILNNDIATITNCAISGNTTNGWGGGIYNAIDGIATITNCTISGNTATTNVGGGILTTTSVTVINSTITNNSGSGIYRNGGSATISNSIIANQAADWDCSNGGFTSNGHNLDSDGSCGLGGAGDISNSALANLGALANNGGTTQTMALLTGSSAINAGDCNGGAITTDQRGTARPQGSACDIGAFELEYFTLSTTVTGSGTVTSDTAGTNCPGTCAESLAKGTSVTLTAAVGAGYTFTGWGGSCAGSAATCNVTVNAATSVTATFTVIPAAIYTLSTTVTGSGTVTSNTAGTNCPGTCSENITDGTAVILTATPASGYSLSGWGGACSGTAATCNVTMTAATSVTATFTAIPPGAVSGCTDPLAANYNPSATVDNGSCVYTLSTTVTGSGTITSDTAGTNCPGTCAENITNGTGVTLTATASSGYMFSGWGGACSGTAATCNVTVNSATDVTATFTAIPPTAVAGCTDYHATNYNSAATVDDGGCVYPDPDFGETGASSLDFGTGKVDTSVQKTITLKNTGAINTYIYSLDISGAPFSIVSDACSGNAIWLDNTCDIVVSFNPSSSGSFTGTLNAWTNAGKYNPLSVPLTGKATVLTVTPATLISPSDGATLAGTQVTFEWTAGSDATGAKVTDSVYVCEQSDFTGCETPALTSRRAAIPAGVIILLGLVAPFGLRNRRVRSALLALVFITAGCATLWSCGGGSSSPGGQSGKALTLKAETKYYWKVVTASVNGTEESEVKSFTMGK